MVDNIYHEARKVDITCKLVSSRAFSLQRRKKSRDVQAKVCQMWDGYETEGMSSKELLVQATEL